MHKISPKAKDIIDSYLPRREYKTQNLTAYGKGVDVIAWLGVVRDLQAALIRLHFPKMDPETQARALDTLVRLKWNRDRPYI